jgi:hypothetical protein
MSKFAEFIKNNSIKTIKLFLNKPSSISSWNNIINIEKNNKNRITLIKYLEAKIKREQKKMCNCGRFYHNKIFKGSCSKCYFDSNNMHSKYNSDKFYIDEGNILLRENARYSINYLNKNKLKAIPKNSNCWKMLSYAIVNNNKCSLIHFIEYLQYNTEYRGINVSDTRDLLDKIKYNSELNDTTNLNLTHIVFSFVIDWWNLTNVNINPIQCYYDKGGLLPKKDEIVRPPPVFDIKNNNTNYYFNQFKVYLNRMN